MTTQRALPLLIALLAGSATGVADSTWDRAVDIYEPNSGWESGRMEIITIQSNRRGVTKSSEHRIFKTILLDGKSRTELEYAEKDGADITEAELENNSSDPEDEGGPDLSDIFPNPFDPSIQDSVERSRIGDVSTAEGVSVIEYEFRVPIDDDRFFAGSAWLDPISGVPVQIDATIEPLPRFAHFLRFVIQFSNDAERWYPVELTMEAAGGMLFVYRRVDSTIRFSEHFRSP